MNATTRRHLKALEARPADAEARLSEYFAVFAARSEPSAVHLLKRWRASRQAVTDLRALTSCEAELGDTAGGREIHRGLVRSKVTHRLLLGVTSALPVPSDPGVYASSPGKQTLRRKRRVAERLGVTWRRVDEPDDRARLLLAANAFERSNPREDYRNTHPDNDDLLDHDLWLVAERQDGTPLLLSVTPVDGAWAALRYFRTLSHDEDASAARYLMTEVLVEQLVGLRVQWLVDQSGPQWLPAGLRHFQRMVGFRLVRVQVRRRLPDRRAAADAGGLFAARPASQPVQTSASSSSSPSIWSSSV